MIGDAPIKTTADLLAIRSDAYAVTETGAVALVPERNGVPPLIELDDAYKLVDDFEARFPAGPPSLIGCRRLRIEGDITFGSRIRVEGDVTLTGGEPVADGTVLSG